MTEKKIQKFLTINWNRLFGLHLNFLEEEHKVYSKHQESHMGGYRIDIIAESKDGCKKYLIELKNESSKWMDACKIVGYRGMFYCNLYSPMEVGRFDFDDFIPTIMIPEPGEDKDIIVGSLRMAGIKWIFFNIDEKKQEIDIVDWEL